MVSPVVWLAAHKAVAIGGAAAIGLGAYSRTKKAGPAAGAGGPPTSVYNTPAPAGSAGYNSTAQDVYSSIEPQLSTLQSEIARLGTGTPAAPSSEATALDTLYGPNYASSFGAEMFRRDAAAVHLHGGPDLAQPTDLGAYGALRYRGSLFAAAHAGDPAYANSPVTPGSSLTVAQAGQEQADFAAGSLGPSRLGATV